MSEFVCVCVCVSACVRACVVSGRLPTRVCHYGQSLSCSDGTVGRGDTTLLLLFTYENTHTHNKQIEASGDPLHICSMCA